MKKQDYSKKLTTANKQNDFKSIHKVFKYNSEIESVNKNEF